MSQQPYVAREYEFDAQYGLPEALPAGERLLWQGAPDWQALARRVFHVNKVALYFALLLVWRVASVLSDGADLATALQSLTWLLPLFAFALALLVLLARWTAHSTVYTLTDKRVVMRIGVVLTVAYNLPLSRIESADLHNARDGCADIALTLERGTRIAWLHLWPHARPWHVARPQPMLRGLRNADAVAALLAQAWSEVNGVAPAAAATAASPAAQPARAPGNVRPVMVTHAG
jgi:Bacterial PH domain